MVRTRFAPSPTGYLHIGGVRTALYNWLFARKHGGRFVLRIDDTDEVRNDEATLQPILDGFRWLGIDWDEGPGVGGPHGPYRQSEKKAAYSAAVEELLKRGAAYRDYATPEELKAEREPVEKAKGNWVYSRRWMAETDADRARFEAEGRKAVVRLKMPREGRCEFRDLVRGDMSIEWASEADHVVQRADGSCLYNLATVVDDYDMKITHVIRSQEHLSNTPRQVFVVRALGYPEPAWAHLPYVAAPNSSEKLSKRKLKDYLKVTDFKKVHEAAAAIARAVGHVPDENTFNPVIVDFYEKTGYLPHTVLNYLLLLGWSFDGEKEEFTRQEMIDLFNLERVNKAPASFDVKKLLAFQERDMKKVPADRKLAMCLPYLVGAEIVPEPVTPETQKVAAILRAAGDRVKVAGDVLDYANLFVADEALEFDDKAFDKRIRKPEGGRALLAAFRDDLAGAPEFDAKSLEERTARFVHARGAALGDIVNAVRVALTGKGVGFGLYETLEVLGKERSLARLERAVARP